MNDRMQQPAPVRDLEVPDAELMKRLASGDAAALGPLHGRYSRMVTSLLLRLDGKRSLADAEDLTQEVFLTLMNTAGRYTEQERLKSWICGITSRISRGARRTVWRRRGLLARERGAPGMALPTTDGVDERLDARRAVARALDSLPAAQREVMVLHAVEGLTGEEIAGVLGMKANAVWVRLSRARARLREELAS